MTSDKKYRMHKPPHPGEVIRELYLKPLGITVTDAAKALGVSRKAFSELLNGHSRISSEMALRLSIAFETTPESWLSNQIEYDIWLTKKSKKKLKVKKLVGKKAA